MTVIMGVINHIILEIQKDWDNDVYFLIGWVK